MITLSDEQVRLLRIRAQLLAPQTPDMPTSVATVVKDVCGIQAQDTNAAALAIRVRSTVLLASDIEHARVQERTIIRTWGQRGTLHLLATEDLSWLLQLFSPVFIAGNRKRREELGLDEDTCVKGIRMLHNILAEQGPLTRDALVEQLTSHGLTLVGQARPHLLQRAALEGVICFGPLQDREPSYVLLSDWVDQEYREHPLSEAAAYVELTRHYLKAYGPATPKDQAVWSGLPLSKIRVAWHNIADQLIEVEIARSPAWMLKTQETLLAELPAQAPIVRLLPYFDTYLLGYQNRDLVVPTQYAKRVNAGGGMVHPTLLVDGRVVGTWKNKREKGGLAVSVEAFESFMHDIMGGLEMEVADIARFLGMEAILHVAQVSL
ncbi:MAG TPA: winged helix DNA-binding domain-containing protein [Ktedonobacteraceae bacterium]|nr:winged helix DNA-binding domain-containing protein [Ktedonobacteraceae bacterium]